jgi:hypothetical protein
MSEHNAIDLAWRMHDSAAAAVDRADTKAGFAATVETAVAAVVLTLLSQAHGSPLLARVLFGLSLVALATALVAAMLVVTPRLHAPGKQLVPGEFLYFGAVRLRSMDQLWKELNSQAPRLTGYGHADVCHAVSHQSKQLAEIAWSKHRLVRVSFLAAGAGGAVAAVGALIGGVR